MKYFHRRISVNDELRLQNVVQGQLVNGSIGKVVDFLTTGEALQRQIQIATINNGEDLPKEPVCLTPITRHCFSKQQRWPLVRFINGMHLLCAPLAFNVEGYLGNVEAQRMQVPLILAWALSIHKSQGQTLSRVKVDLKRIFEKGQGKASCLVKGFA
jgi:ATP-dependent DNA helicase PIF1